MRDNRERSIRRTLVRTGLSGLLAAAMVLPAQALGATGTGCGEYSFGFEGTRLMNDGISTSAGPYTINLPAGTYDVTMVSHDAHDEHPGQVEQTQEQFYFVLDSGYTSPPSNDIPLESNDMTTVVGAQEIAASTAITVFHLGQGGINSVDVRCVGFTPVTVAGPVDPEPEPEPEPEVVPEPDPEPEPEVAAPDPEPEPEPEAAAPAPEPEPEVKAVVQAPVAQLAATGPPDLALALFGMGLFMVGYGIVLANIEAFPLLVARVRRDR